MLTPNYFATLEAVRVRFLGRKGSVLIVNKGNPPQSASEVAQGGIAVAMEGSDSTADHRDDTERFSQPIKIRL